MLKGGFVQSQSNNDAVIVVGKKPNHILHGVLTLCTCVWGFVWLFLIFVKGERRIMITVDEWGNVSERRLGKA